MTDRTEHLLAWLDDLRAREVDELYVRQEIEAERNVPLASSRGIVPMPLPMMLSTQPSDF